MVTGHALNPNEGKDDSTFDQSEEAVKMGCGASKPDPKVKEAASRNDKIERQLRQDKRTESRTVKILLLGTQPTPQS